MKWWKSVVFIVHQVTVEVPCCKNLILQNVLRFFIINGLLKVTFLWHSANSFLDLKSRDRFYFCYAKYIFFSWNLHESVSPTLTSLLVSIVLLLLCLRWLVQKRCSSFWCVELLCVPSVSAWRISQPSPLSGRVWYVRERAGGKNAVCFCKWEEPHTCNVSHKRTACPPSVHVRLRCEKEHTHLS